MSRAGVFSSLAGLAAIIFAQSSPTPLAPPNPHNTPPACPAPGTCATCPSAKFDNTLCICASYPIYQDDNNAVLYYSEICSPSTDCTITDIAYYWALPDVNWPIECNTGGTPGECPPCYNFAFTDPPAFVGMKQIAQSGHTVKANLFPEQVARPTPMTGNSYPRKGVVSENSEKLFVSFQLGRETIYAKLFVVRVNGAAANAPNSAQSNDRLLFVGYEVYLTDDEKKLALPARSEKAYRKASPAAVADSEAVRKVSIGGNKFLVLLGTPPSRPTPPANVRAVAPDRPTEAE